MDDNGERIRWRDCRVITHTLTILWMWNVGGEEHSDDGHIVKKKTSFDESVSALIIPI